MFASLADPVKRGVDVLDPETKVNLKKFMDNFGFATGGAKEIEKRQFETCPFDVCADRCNFAPPFCLNDFCDWNNLGCLAGCCVACGC
jgi:hypothetical protein